MSKHTPGPWFTCEYGGVNGRGIEIGCDMTRDGFHKIAKIEMTKYSKDEWGNANLIAAAPDLLEALECLKREVILSDVDMAYIDTHFKPWLEKARAAIAKARGEK